VKPLKSERAKTYYRPFAPKSGAAFALPALQLVPPLPTEILVEIIGGIKMKFEDPDE